MSFLKRSNVRRVVTLATLLAALASSGCEGWLGPADDEGRPTVGQMREGNRATTGTPGEDEPRQEEE